MQLSSGSKNLPLHHSLALLLLHCRKGGKGYKLPDFTNLHEVKTARLVFCQKEESFLYYCFSLNSFFWVKRTPKMLFTALKVFRFMHLKALRKRSRRVKHSKRLQRLRRIKSLQRLKLYKRCKRIYSKNLFTRIPFIVRCQVERSESRRTFHMESFLFKPDFLRAKKDEAFSFDMIKENSTEDTLNALSSFNSFVTRRSLQLLYHTRARQTLSCPYTSNNNFRFLLR